MSRMNRELAKFLAGFAASETIAHWWVGLWANDLLPMRLGVFTLTPPINMFAMMGWPIVLVALVYFGWCRREEPKSLATPRSIPA